MHRSFLLPCFLILFAFLENAQAVPGFARQTGLDCMFCHAQNQSKLNSFGRQFARSAYTMSTDAGPQSLITGEDLGLSIPMVLNLSLMLKARVETGNDVINGKGQVLQTKNQQSIDVNRGMYEIFKTSTLNIAGRVSDHVGSIIEFREKEGKTIIGGKVVTAIPTGDAYSGMAIFSTNNYGPFTGMENYNTGLYKPLRQFDNHKLTNAAQATDLASGAATGIQAYYAGKNLFVTVGAYVPAHNSDGIDIGTSMIPFARLAYEQPIGDMRIIAGAYGLKGRVTASNTSLDPTITVPQALVDVDKEAYGVDLQIEGHLQEMDTLLTMNAVLKNKTTLNDPNLMAGGDPSDADSKAFSIELELNPRPAFGVKMAYLKLDDNGPYPLEPEKIDVKDKNAVTLGLDYSFRQNIKFTMEYSMVEPTQQEIGNYTDLLSVLTISF